MKYDDYRKSELSVSSSADAESVVLVSEIDDVYEDEEVEEDEEDGDRNDDLENYDKFAEKTGNVETSFNLKHGKHYLIIFIYIIVYIYLNMYTYIYIYIYDVNY